MSKLSKVIALALLTVMSVTSVPETVLAKEIAFSNTDNAYIANDDEEPAQTSEQDEPSEKPTEKQDEKTSEQPTEQPDENPSGDKDKEPAETTGEEPSDVEPEAPSGNTDDDTAGETPKQDPAPVDPVDSIPVVAGTWDTAGGKKIFVDEAGNRVKGFCFIGEKLYFFDEEGIMKTGWLLLTDGTRRYFNNDGSGVINGWKKIGKYKYHFDAM